MESVKFSQEKSARKKYLIANMVRNEAQIGIIEKKTKEEKERRVRTAQVYNIRSLLRSKCDTSRQLAMERRGKTEASHRRTRSTF